MSLFACKAWLALLQEGGHGLFVLGCAMRHRLHACRHLKQCLQLDLRRLAEQAFRHTESVAGVDSDPLGKSMRCFEQLLVGYDLRDQPTGQSLCCINSIARKGHLISFGESHDAGQEPGSAVAWDDTQLDETFRKGRTLAGNTNIAHAGKIAASAYGCAIHSSDNGNFKGEEGSWDALNAVDVPGTYLHWRKSGEVADFLEIPARRE